MEQGAASLKPRQPKFLIIAATTLVLVGAGITAFNLTRQTKEEEKVLNPTNSLPTETQATDTAKIEPTQNAATSTAEIQNPQNFPILLTVDDGKKLFTYEVEANEKDTAFDILQKASQQNEFTLEYNEYDFGVMITQIGESEPAEGRYWMYYVNGELASVGADNYEVSEGDEILWRLE